MTRASKRPSFVLFITDQHRADYLGCYGHPVLRTPHIDSIAARGTAFDRFYVNSPVCMPNRASLMTGRMPSVHGVRSNGIPLSRQAVTFTELLRAAGYRTALIGKSHLQNFTGNPPLAKPRVPPEGYRSPPPSLAQAVRNDLDSADYDQEQPGFWQRDDAHVETPYYGFDHVELVRGHGDTVNGDYMHWLLAREPKAADMLGPENSLPHDYICPQAHRTAIPAELYSTAYIAERAAAYLAEQAARDDDTPFFLMVSFPDPHHPFNPPGKYWDMYKPAQFPVPEAFSRNDWTPPPHVQEVIDARDRGTANLKGMRSIATTPREAQEAQALTCGMIACIDDAVGVVLGALDDSGRTDDTVVTFTTDHGDHLGDHRLLLKGAEQYQSIVRVPFIWHDPQAPRGGARSGALASTLDIPATILDRAQLTPYYGLQGRSLLPVIDGKDNGREAAFIQYDHQLAGLPPDMGLRVHSLVDARWRISVVLGRDDGELYDLAADPGEFNNLWTSQAHAGVRAELMERLARIEMAHVDRVPIPTQQA
ncbi:MAG: sulfatase-like hydrolase/transferase [Rhodopseudomonas sp.]|nr:sulfatase-like hydrolase/transferase [Rhodopseudomonas sp.]